MIIDDFHKFFRQIITKNHPKIIDSSTSGACKKFSSPPRFISYFFDPKRTNSDPISTIFRQKTCFFDLGRIIFSVFRRQFFSMFRYFYSFSAPKRGVQSIPRVVALLPVFFSSQTDKFSLNFNDFFDFRGLRIHRPTTGPRARGPTSLPHEIGG